MGRDTYHPLDVPFVDAVGVMHVPAGWRRQAAGALPRRRSLAMVMAAIFAAMTLATGALSLGAYCLTSGGPDVRHAVSASR